MYALQAADGQTHFTVVLLFPDYYAGAQGKTCRLNVPAHNQQHAIAMARRGCMVRNRIADIENLEELQVVEVFPEKPDPAAMD